MRRAGPGDVVAIATVHSVTTGHAYAGIFPPDAPKPTVDELATLWQDRVEASCRARTSSPVAVFVAEASPDPIGTAIPAGPANTASSERAAVVGIAACELLDASPLDGRSGIALLRSFHVLPDQWDRGLGRALHGSIVAQARGWGATAIDVLVLEGNDRGRRWYLRQGYEPTGVRLAAFEDLGLHDEGLRLAAPFPSAAA